MEKNMNAYVRSSILPTVTLVLATFGTPSSLPAQCAATTEKEAFVPPQPYRSSNSFKAFWFGTSVLWTSVAPEAFHIGDERRLSAKLVFWRVGFDWQQEPEPELAAVARRLDGPAPLVWAQRAHGIKLPNDNTPSGTAMMTGISIPVAGCWEISANYKGQILSYVVAVQP